MKTPLRIGIAGLGTVGSAVGQIVQTQKELLAARCGRDIVITAASARNQAASRGFALDGITWFSHAPDMAADANVDVVVELIGGAQGVARELVERALQAGKSVVTANKALIAEHATSLAKIAEQSGATLAFEAAVAGGIPIIKCLRDGLAANKFSRIVGILNGTCNYILTQMTQEGLAFDVALKQAQSLGYAEADPTFDVEGIDTAHKIAILASLAFGSVSTFAQVQVEGITKITARDIEFARELGYRIKLLGIAAQSEEGVDLRVHPSMVPIHSQLANVHGAYNAVVVEGHAVGRVLLEGAGAGGGPTASSVVADIMDLARGVQYHPLTLPASMLAPSRSRSIEAVRSAHYLRLSVIDKPGVLAEVTDIFRNQHISLRSFLQHSHQPNESVQLVLTTHQTTEYAMRAAVASIARLQSTTQPPQWIRMEES